MRGAILVAVGAGVLVVPHVWWLFVGGVLLAALIAWPTRRSRQIVLSPTLGDAAQHYHYCSNCDQQWRHIVPHCVAHWATPCQDCTATDTPTAALRESA
jgi:hypothetical protein